MEKTMNIMNMEAEKYQMAESERTYLMETGTELLTKYCYHPTVDGMNKIFNTWAEQKAWIINLFQKSPNYVDGKFYIKVPAELKRGVDKEALRTFIDWATNQVDKLLAERELMVGMFTLDEYMKIKNSYTRIANSLSKGYTYNGYTMQFYVEEMRRMEERVNEVGNYTYNYENGIYVRPNDENSASNLRRIFKHLMNMPSETIATLSENDVSYINIRLENNTFVSNRLKASVGMKTTKFYGKLMKELGMDKIVDVRTREWTDATTGEIHSRQIDMGYNHYRPLLGDSINPITYKTPVYISVNPLDFWGMSIGHKWASCHTIDKENVRCQENNYQGAYSGGTESYMLDGVSMVVYTLPDVDKLSEAERELPDECKPKLKRCMFFMGEDKLFQSRLYPDGRDGGDEGLAAQIRNIVQKEVAEMLGANNMWTLRKGSSSVCELLHTHRYAAHYPDYDCCSDVSVSLLHRINGDLNLEKIEVGADIICPCCGDVHTTSECIECDDCYNGASLGRCDNCDRSIRDEFNYIYVEESDVTFCCADCARNYGYIFTEDDERWHNEEDCHYDNYIGEYFYDTDDIVITEEGNVYQNQENAFEDGNEWCTDIENYSDNFVVTESGNAYHNTDNLIYVDGKYYEDEAQVLRDGYAQDENGEWYLA